MTTLTLIRGLPGSGKSTLAANLLKADGTIYILEADMYFVDENGNYDFDITEIHDAHRWCRKETRDYLLSGYDVVVSNTFTMLKEMVPYYDMAQELGVEFNVITCLGQFGNVHDVPEETLAKMKARFFHGDVLDALKERYKG